MFHVSQLRKYIFDPSHVLEAENVQIRKDLTMEVPPVSLVKVIWDWRTGDSTWELEEDMRKSHPHLFSW